MAVQKGGEKLGYESEAFAIYDTMRYIKPSVRTLCVGTAFGESAMLLATGEKVHHCCCIVAAATTESTVEQQTSQQPKLCVLDSFKRDCVVGPTRRTPIS